MINIPWDKKEHPEICDCTFSPFENGDIEESFHYLRECPHCKYQ